jgi:hypothetical protein
MGKRLSAVVSAIFLMPFAYPHSALSWNWNALSYQEAAWICGTGNLQACEVMYAYEMARSGMSVTVRCRVAAQRTLQYRKIAPYPQAQTTRIRWRCHHPEIDDRRTLSSQHTASPSSCRTTRA